MKATRVLRDEHEGILAMLSVVEAAARRLESGKSIPPQMMVDAGNFFRNFADGCHHGKEEGELFPTMVEHGIPKEGGPVGVMLLEHDEGRAFVRGMREAAERYARGDESANLALVDNTLDYVRLLRAHIAKENNVLFPMADEILSDDEQAKLFDAFEHIEQTRTGPGEHERYHAMIGEYQTLVAGWN
ncbi:MAG: hemerythrin domain-containing protein [Chloroflexi bacterium]|nr:hemerythrin domain-containing protein [Chloroflexota bacterium]